jgi:hypothetical protein
LIRHWLVHLRLLAEIFHGSIQILGVRLSLKQSLCLSLSRAIEIKELNR